MKEIYKYEPSRVALTSGLEGYKRRGGKGNSKEAAESSTSSISSESDHDERERRERFLEE